MIAWLKRKLRSLFPINLNATNYLLRELTVNTLLMKKKYDDPNSLIPFGYQVFSQSDEDGIIDEIFNRIQPENKVFVEFGASDGIENNTLNLLVQGWKGFWIEGSEELHSDIVKNFKIPIERNQLRTANTFVDKENIENVFNKLQVPRQIDLLSIDIDGNDYWVWEGIRNYDAKVVVIEYNAEFGAKTKWIMKYDKNYLWNGSCCYGASLKALEELGEKKGYKLVGCNLYGINAFFIKEELLNGNFREVYRSEDHYESPKYELRPKRVRKVDLERLFLETIFCENPTKEIR